MSASSDWNQSPLASPSAAEIHAFSVIGAERGAASDVDSKRPNRVARRTLPSLIGRTPQRLGTSVSCMTAARSPVRLLQSTSFAQSAE
jgi:hypothetical protein